MKLKKISFLLHILKYHSEEKDSFIYLLIHLIEKKYICFDKCDYLLTKFDKNSKKAVVNIVKFLVDIPFTNFQENLKIFKFANEWKNLIKIIKNIKKPLYEYVNLPNYAPKKKIQIKKVFTSVEIVEVANNSGIFNSNCQNFRYDFHTFYKLFNKKFGKIVVQGKPGIGKSVQYRYLTYLWAIDKWDDDSDERLLLNVKVMDIKEDEDLYDTILRQNFYDIPYISKDLLKIIMNENKENIILFIDGADELNNDNMDLKVLIECITPDMNTIIWSRNWKVKDILYDLLYEMKGFNESQLEIFLFKCFSGNEKKTKRFLKQLKFFDDNLKELLRIPLLALNLFILQSNDDDICTKTRYDIYTKILNLINPRVEDNENLIMKEVIKQCFKQLSKNRVKLEFNKTECEELESLIGQLSQITRFTDKYSNNSTIEFYHLSFQEYFASKYLLKKSKKYLFHQKIEKHFKSVSTKNIFSLMDFIRDEDSELFNKILLKSTSVSRQYNLNDEIKSYLIRENTFEIVNLFNEKPFDDEIILHILQKQSCVKILKLSINFNQISTILLKINQLCTGLTTLKLHFYPINSLQQSIFSDFIKFLDKVVVLDSLRFLIINGIYFMNFNENISTFSILHPDNMLHIVFESINFELDLSDIIINDDIPFIILTYLQQNSKIISILTNSSKYFQILLENQSAIFLQDICLVNSTHSYFKWKKFIQRRHNIKFIYEESNDYHIFNFKSSILTDILQYSFFEDLQKFQDLETICFQSIDLYDKNWEIIKIFPIDFSNKIKAIDLSHSFVEERLFFFLDKQNLQNLQLLIFSDCGLKEGLRIPFEKMLLKFSVIQEIDFSQNVSLNSACLKILRGLAKCKETLRKINFSGCGLKGKNFEDADKVLSVFINISEIDFSLNPQLNYGCLFILLGLRNCESTLKNINFTDCGLSQSNKIGNALMQFSALKKLNFNFCKIFSSGGCINIDKGLKSCRMEFLLFNNIREIDFSGCEFYGWAFNRLIKGLCNCRYTLSAINFSNCNLNERATTAIDKILIQFFNIKEINFSNNPFLMSGFSTILQGLFNSDFCLQRINFSNCGINENHTILIADILHKFVNILEVHFENNISLQSGCLFITKSLAKSRLSLKIINFSNCGLSGQNVMQFDEILSVFLYLTKVDFHDNESLDLACFDILNGLINSKFTIQTIDLSKCNVLRLYDGTFEDWSLKFGFFSLKDINLGNNFCFKGMHINFMKRLVPSHLTLCDLDLSCNLIEKKCLGKLFKLFPCFDLSCVNIGFELKNVLEGLTNYGKTLQQINFFRCFIYDKDIEGADKNIIQFCKFKNNQFFCKSNINKRNKKHT